MSEKHLNRATIGPNTDQRAAIVVLAYDILEREARVLSDAQSDLMNWAANYAARRTTARSVKAARRAVCKAEARVKAATEIHSIAVAHAERRVYVFTDAAQTSPALNLGVETPEAATGSSGASEALGIDDTGAPDQGMVTLGNCACVRMAHTPEMGPLTPYGHHPRCTLPYPSADPYARAFWPISSMVGAAM